jgi:hypothetical protein
MTYGELITKATPEQRKEMRSRIEKIIGTKEQAMRYASDLTDRIKNARRWESEYEKLAKVFLENGEKALALNFVQKGRYFEGVTASGKKWELEGNNGWTERSRYCGRLWIEGEGTVFTSGKLDKVFDYILNT